eukprot:s3265_g18.t1
MEVLNVINGDDWKGGALILLDDMVTRPSATVPSAYFLCDVFLMLHRVLNNKLFRPDRSKGQSVYGLAAEEATKAKKCIGALRYLWRNSQNSYDPFVQDLKSLLESSPIQEANARAAAEAEASENGTDEEAGAASAGEEGGEGAGAAEAEASSSEVEQANEEVEDEMGDGSGDDASSLNAPTLRLGEESDSSSASPRDHEDEGENEFADSQVRPEGCLGGFYTKWKTAYGDGLTYADGYTPAKNPNLGRVKPEMNSEAVAYAMDSVGITMSEEVVRELALGLSDIYSDLLSQDETLAEQLGPAHMT